MGEARCGQLTPAETPTRRTVGTSRDDGYGGCSPAMKWALLSTYLVTAGSEAGALAGAPPRQRFSGARASLAGRRGRSWSEQQRAGAPPPSGRGSAGAAHGRDRPNAPVYLTGVIKPNTPGHIKSARGMGPPPAAWSLLPNRSEARIWATRDAAWTRVRAPAAITAVFGRAHSGDEAIWQQAPWRAQIPVSRADPQVAGSDRAARPLTRDVAACRRSPVAPDKHPARAVRRSPPGLIVGRTDSRSAADSDGRSTRGDARAPPTGGTRAGATEKRGVGTVFRPFPPPLFGVCMSAVTYSPTPYRVQYHRRWRA